MTTPEAIMNGGHKLKVFTGRSNMPLAEKIAQCVGDPLGKLTIQSFPDGETFLRTAIGLALFVPVVLALAESVGIQSVTLTLQALHQRGRRLSATATR